MSSAIGLSEGAIARLRCPVCHAKLRLAEGHLACDNEGHGARFPVVSGVPVVLNESASIFSTADYLAEGRAPLDETAETPLRRVLKRLVPSLGENLKGAQNYQRFASLVTERGGRARVLVLGGKILGKGMEVVANHPAIELVETDVGLGPRTQMVCDAHDIPFADASFDGVIAQAVLEHVVDPHRCVDEIHRVLAPFGVVYAETPFMQQVHAGRYDFTRFTHLGHRRLFRRFDEIDGGAAAGPAMALAWSYKYFLTAFTTSKRGGLVAAALAGLTSFHLKYLDGLLIDKPGALDAASVFYFLGRRSEKVLADRDLVKLYKGVNKQ